MLTHRFLRDLAHPAAVVRACGVGIRLAPGTTGMLSGVAANFVSATFPPHKLHLISLPVHSPKTNETIAVVRRVDAHEAL